jgi:hypothetical protein
MSRRIRRIRIVREEPNVLHGEQIIAIMWYGGRLLSGLYLACEIVFDKLHIENALIGFPVLIGIFIVFWMVTGKIGKWFLKLIGWESED